MGGLTYLCSPIEIKGKIFKNRILTAPAGLLVMAKDGTFPPGEGHNDFIKKAKGGCAAVTIGETPVDQIWANRFMDFFHDFENHDSPQKVTWRRVAADIKAAGALAFVQLYHVGAMRTTWGKVTKQPVAIGPVGYTRKNGEIVKAADESDMQQICDSFARAALYMKDAGFDGINIHGGHGWMLQQWLSPRTNRRTDAYGGCIDNRCRFPVRLLNHIREKVGDDFIIELRVSGEEPGVENGMQKEQIARLAQLLEGIVDIIHISAGIYTMPIGSRVYSTMYHEHFCNLEQAAFVKANIKNMLVTIVGGINSPEEADRLIGKGKIDFISLGRQLLADVNFAKKCMSGNAWDIKRCIRCFHCTHTGDKRGEEIDFAPAPLGPVPKPDQDVTKTGFLKRDRYCSVNPEAGLTPPPGGWPQVISPRKVLIIGGGCAGMMAAITAADRGHHVTLVEKTDRLGGILKFLDYDTFKSDLKNYRDLLIRRISERNIRLLLNVRADENFINNEAPDYIIVAIGSLPERPDIPGLNHAISALEVYGNDSTGESVVILGGGLTGCETAIYLAAQGEKVTLLKRSHPVAHDTTEGGRQIILDQFARLEIEYRTGLKIIEIRKNGVLVQTNERLDFFYPADAVVYALGMKPDKDTLNKLQQAAGKIPFKAVGDCITPGDVAKAIRSAYVAAMEII